MLSWGRFFSTGGEKKRKRGGKEEKEGRGKRGGAMGKRGGANKMFYYACTMLNAFGFYYAQNNAPGPHACTSICYTPKVRWLSDLFNRVPKARGE